MTSSQSHDRHDEQGYLSAPFCSHEDRVPEGLNALAVISHFINTWAMVGAETQVTQKHEQDLLI